MKKIIIIATTLLILGAVNLHILQKEKTIDSGQTMLLQLRPVDPRSLMQGDYMILRYAIADVAANHQLSDKGCIVVSLDDNSVATFVRVHAGESLQENEHLLFYRKRGSISFGAESFLFQEGDANLYSQARYGELKVDPSGTSVLIGLRGEGFNPLGKK